MCVIVIGAIAIDLALCIYICYTMMHVYMCMLMHAATVWQES